MGIDFYYIPGSAPCRAVLLAAKALGVTLNLKLTNLQAGDHLKPEFVKINPQHTVPTLVDDGFALWESRAIITYLANKYGKGSSLYPADPQARALVDQKLYFDMGTLYQSLANYYYPVLFAGAPEDASKFEKIGDAFKFLDIFLEGQEFAAGKQLTLADLTLVATVSTFEALDYDFSQYKNVVRWYQGIKKSAPGYQEANAEGVAAFRAMVQHLKKK